MSGYGKEEKPLELREIQNGTPLWKIVGLSLIKITLVIYPAVPLREMKTCPLKNS